MRRLTLCLSILLLTACSIPVEVTVNNTCDVERFRFSPQTKAWIAGLYYPKDHPDPSLRGKPRPGTPPALAAELPALLRVVTSPALAAWLSSQVGRPGTPPTLQPDLARLGKTQLVIDENCGQDRAKSSRSGSFAGRFTGRLTASNSSAFPLSR